jgi:hypothetical protein
MLCRLAALSNSLTPHFRLTSSALHHLSHRPGGQFHQQYSSVTIAMASNEASLRAFFQSPKYAVVGASTNTAKYGYKGQQATDRSCYNLYP